VVVTTFEAPSVLVGQNDWVSMPVPNPCGPGTLAQPTGGAAWTGSALLVPDTFSGRLLAFSPIPPAENDPTGMPAASWAIGEPSLTTCSDSTGTLFLPQAPSLDGGRLAVADSGDNKVFVYATVPSDSGATASRSTVGDGSTGCAPTSLSDPRGVFLTPSRLIVADTGHNRVLVYEPVAHDLSLFVLKLVLGQLDPSTTGSLCAANDVNGSGVSSSSPNEITMNGPKAVWTDGTHLVVADSGNNRLLVWNTFPTASGQAADAVVGQASFTTAAIGAAGAKELWDPESIASDGTQLFVADTGNNRVVVFPSIPSTSTPAATIVLGQADFGCSFPNDAGNGTTCNGASGATPSQRTLKGPTGVSVVNGRLSITDTGNSRLVIFGN
jgi:hypothetical protein